MLIWFDTCQELLLASNRSLNVQKNVRRRGHNVRERTHTLMKLLC
jgi:hypothetical protein